MPKKMHLSRKEKDLWKPKLELMPSTSLFCLERFEDKGVALRASISLVKAVLYEKYALNTSRRFATLGIISSPLAVIPLNRDAAYILNITSSDIFQPQLTMSNIVHGITEDPVYLGCDVESKWLFENLVLVSIQWIVLQEILYIWDVGVYTVQSKYLFEKLVLVSIQAKTLQKLCLMLQYKAMELNFIYNFFNPLQLALRWKAKELSQIFSPSPVWASYVWPLRGYKYQRTAPPFQPRPEMVY
jgi:hypothetical protein